SANGWSALHYAAMNGNAELVQLLLSSGADPNYAGNKDGQANAAAVKPLVLAQVCLELEGIVDPAELEGKLRSSGLDDPALMKSLKGPTASERYISVVQMLTKVTKGS
ncbi:MAG: ankyrin repeat domain-containing protein, partial [Terracidiphilus sp.]